MPARGRGGKPRQKAVPARVELDRRVEQAEPQRPASGYQASQAASFLALNRSRSQEGTRLRPFQRAAQRRQLLFGRAISAARPSGSGSPGSASIPAYVIPSVRATAALL